MTCMRMKTHLSQNLHGRPLRSRQVCVRLCVRVPRVNACVCVCVGGGLLQVHVGGSEQPKASWGYCTVWTQCQQH